MFRVDPVLFLRPLFAPLSAAAVRHTLPTFPVQVRQGADAVRLEFFDALHHPSQRQALCVQSIWVFRLLDQWTEALGVARPNQ